ncbi:hypothetical protein [Pseudomonas aeruginosa]|uniref:hypothetical protein n=1 Tax=Pseudomonas aeruginosa TaxID=287 RepID=UPI0021B25B97|nr:hypothetical protein [Pseudomonas aeruginosa]MCT7418590.1 hypothetical protein [Pseudomonas aeruginosa]
MKVDRYRGSFFAILDFCQGLVGLIMGLFVGRHSRGRQDICATAADSVGADSRD